MTIADFNAAVSSVPDKSYIYGVRLISGREVQFAAGTVPKAEAIGIPQLQIPIDDTGWSIVGNCIKFAQGIQTPQGPQIGMTHFLDIDKIEEILVFIKN